jgi:hypothetical protein
MGFDQVHSKAADSRFLDGAHLSGGKSRAHARDLNARTGVNSPEPSGAAVHICVDLRSSAVVFSGLRVLCVSVVKLVIRG